MFLAHTQSGEGRTLEGDEFITLIVVIFSLVYAYLKLCTLNIPSFIVHQ